MAGRHARLSVRDELFLLAHDEDRDFRPRIHVPTLSVGLAGAALIDLLLDGEVEVVQRHITIRNPDQERPVHDPISGQILNYLWSARDWLPLRTVISDTGATGLYEKTLDHLDAENILTETKRLLGRRRYQPTDAATLVRARAHPRTRIKTLGRSDHLATPATDALCALLRLLHLEDTLNLELATSNLQQRLDLITQHIPTHDDPQSAAIPDILTALDTTAGDVAVAVYR